jgi:tRNA A37 methylthiotransferase MiaB
VPEEIKTARWNALMARQQKISAQRLKRKVGTRQQIIIDEVGPTVSKGRSKADAPQIDGSVYGRAAARSRSARSSPRKSTVRINTTCTGPWRGSSFRHSGARALRANPESSNGFR